jgi:hypothetical protein
MTQARRRLGPGPLRKLFLLLRGPSPGGRGGGDCWWSLHWVRDVTYQEDKSPVRTGNAPLVMATLPVDWPSASWAWTATPTSPPPTGTTPETPNAHSSCFRPYERLCRIPGAGQTGPGPSYAVSFRENHWPGLADHHTVALPSTLRHAVKADDLHHPRGMSPCAKWRSTLSVRLCPWGGPAYTQFATGGERCSGDSCVW